MKISHFAVKHPTIIAMLLIVLIVFGIYSVTGMKTEFMGDISLPAVIVFTVYPGAGAEDVEKDVTKILEDDFVTLPNFKSISSQSSNSLSYITVTYRDGVVPEDQLPEIRNRITQLEGSLPDGISGSPLAIVGGAGMLPVITFTVNGGSDTARVTEFIKEELTPLITQIEGVAEVSVSGGRELELSIILKLDDLAAKGISVSNVYQMLNYGNISLPVGNAEYRNRTIDVRYSGGFKSLEDIKGLPVGFGDGSVPIKLSDVAEVQLAYPKQTYYVTDGKNPLIVVSVTKRSDGDTVGVVNDIKKVLKQTEIDSNGAVSYFILSDDSKTVASSLSAVVSSGLTGIVMAILVILLFLSDFRATIIIGISIPLSILFTFIGMRLFGMTFNLMSLSGLVIALGMIVDGSIVMLEQVYRYYTYKDTNGLSTFTVNDSVFRGSDEVGSSIFASTATTIAVFVPIAMLSGLIGMVLRDISITLIFALFASFLVAVIIVPFLMKVLLPEGGPKKTKKGRFAVFLEKFEFLYRKALAWVLQQWKFITIIALSVLIISLFIMQALGMTFLPSTDTGQFFVAADFSKGTSLEVTHSKMMEIHDLIEEYVPEAETILSYSGRGENGIAGAASNHQCYANVVLVPSSKRDRRVQEIILQMQEVVSARIPDAKVQVTNGGFDKLVGFVSGGGGYGLKLTGENMDQLYSTAKEIEAVLAKDPDIVTTSIDTSFDISTMVIDMSQEYLSSLGITSYEAGITSAILFQGMDAGRFKNDIDGSRYNIRLESDITGKQITPDDIANVHIVSSSGKNVSFASLADIRVDESVSQINRKNRAKTISIAGYLSTEDTTGVNNRMQSYLDKHPLPAGIKSETGGMMELLGDSLTPMIMGLLIAWFLVYTVMVLQFERFQQPFIIMATIPFCIIGVVLGLLMFGSTLSLISMLGIISLGGIVVNNGIILIDYMNLLRSQNEKDDSSKEDRIQILERSVIDGSASRIKPIFMTTLTTILGVVPMAFSSGEGAEMYAPLGQAIAGGLLSSTVITLFIIPILYFVSEKRRIQKQSIKKTTEVFHDTDKK